MTHRNPTRKSGYRVPKKYSRCEGCGEQFPSMGSYLNHRVNCLPWQVMNPDG